MARRPKVVRLRKGKVPDDSKFIETLVWALSRARAGEIKAYAIAFLTEEPDSKHSFELAASAGDGANEKLRLLGMTQIMQQRILAEIDG